MLLNYFIVIAFTFSVSISFAGGAFIGCQAVLLAIAAEQPIANPSHFFAVQAKLRDFRLKHLNSLTADPSLFKKPVQLQSEESFPESVDKVARHLHALESILAVPKEGLYVASVVNDLRKHLNFSGNLIPTKRNALSKMIYGDPDGIAYGIGRALYSEISSSQEYRFLEGWDRLDQKLSFEWATDVILERRKPLRWALQSGTLKLRQEQVDAFFNEIYSGNPENLNIAVMNTAILRSKTLGEHGLWLARANTFQDLGRRWKLLTTKVPVYIDRLIWITDDLDLQEIIILRVETAFPVIQSYQPSTGLQHQLVPVAR